MIISSANKRFLIAYLLLVGLPLLGLVGVLKAGRGLMAPISVDGAWKSEPDSSNSAALPCSKSIRSMQDSLLLISQSGKGLLLSLDHGSKTSSPGAIEGNTVRATIPPSDTPTDGRCGLMLVATVDPKAEPSSMWGTISVSDCPSCPPVKWHAVQQARAKGAF
jgi:hypothetical protein